MRSRNRTAFRKKLIAKEVSGFVMFKNGEADKKLERRLKEECKGFMLGEPHKAGDRQRIREYLFRHDPPCPEVSEADPTPDEYGAASMDPEEPTYRKRARKHHHHRHRPEEEPPAKRPNPAEQPRVRLVLKASSAVEIPKKPAAEPLKVAAAAAAVAAEPPKVAAAAVAAEPPKTPSLSEQVTAIQSLDISIDEKHILVQDVEMEFARRATLEKVAVKTAEVAAMEEEESAILRKLQDIRNAIAEKRAEKELAEREAEECVRRHQKAIEARTNCSLCCNTVAMTYSICYTCPHVVCGACVVKSARLGISQAKSKIVEHNGTKYPVDELIKCVCCLGDWEASLATAARMVAERPLSLAATVPVAARCCLDPHAFLNAVEAAADIDPQIRIEGKALVQMIGARQLETEFIMDPDVRGFEVRAKANCPRCGMLAFGVTNLNLNTTRCINPLCATIFCRVCKVPYHEGLPCAPQPPAFEALQVVEDKTFKRCPGCSVAVTHYKGHGCPSVTCRNCATTFCYHCMTFGARPHAPTCVFMCGDSCGCPKCPDCSVNHHCDDCDHKCL